MSGRPGTAPEKGSRPGTGGAPATPEARGTPQFVLTPMAPGEEPGLDRQLYNCAVANKLFLVNSLLALGANPDGHRSQHGNTALMVASMSADTGPVVSALLRAGASADAVNNFGDTALGLARHYKAVDTMRRLEAGDGIEKGAVMRVGLRTEAPAAGSALEAARGISNQSAGAALLDTIEAKASTGGGGISAAAAADIAALQVQLAQRDATIKERDETIAARDTTIAARDATIAALHEKMIS